MTREEVVEEARGYLGTPFVHRGRALWGLDCVGLVVAVYSKWLNLSTVGFDYPRSPTSAFAFKAARIWAKHIDRSCAGPGDLALVNEGGRSTHFAILTDRGIIHADPILGRVVEHGSGAYRIVSTFAMKGVPWASFK